MKKELELFKNVQTLFQETLNQVCQSLNQLQIEFIELCANLIVHHVDMANSIDQ